MEGGVVARCWNVMNVSAEPSSHSLYDWSTNGRSNEINMIPLHALFMGAGARFEEGENEEQVKYQAACHHELVASAIATKLAHEIDLNNKVGCMLAAGPNYLIPVFARCLGWSRRRPARTISSSMCRRRNTQTMLRKSGARDGWDDWSWTCNYWRSIRWILFHSPIMLVGSL